MEDDSGDRLRTGLRLESDGVNDAAGTIGCDVEAIQEADSDLIESHKICDLNDLKGFLLTEPSDTPCVVLGPGPSLHAHMWRQYNHTITIGIDEVVQIVTPNVWVCTERKHIPTHHVRTISIFDHETACVYRQFLHLSDEQIADTFEIDIVHDDIPLVRAVRLAYAMGARRFHLDGFDVEPNANGESFSSVLNQHHAHTPMDLAENEIGLVALVKMFPAARFVMYSRAPRLQHVRQDRAERFWKEWLKLTRRDRSGKKIAPFVH